LISDDKSANRAYDSFAPVYDAWNAQNDYKMWLGQILLPELKKLGLAKGGWVLDIGCGTGRAFDALLREGWKVVGCDLSPEMLREAERKYGSKVALLELDARRLPPIAAPGYFDRNGFQLVLLLNDVINYLIDDGDLAKVFAGVRRNLGAGGLVAFDSNTLSLFRESYSIDSAEQRKIKGWSWRGIARDIRPGGVFEGVLSGKDFHTHRQRHWLPAEILGSLRATGFQVEAVLGQREEGDQIVLSQEPDEGRDAKVLYFARLPVDDPPEPPESTLDISPVLEI